MICHPKSMIKGEKSIPEKSLGDQMTLPVQTKLEEIIHSNKDSKQFTRKVNDGGLCMTKQRERWKSDLGITINENLWCDFCQNSLFATLNATFKLVNNNFLQ